MHISVLLVQSLVEAPNHLNLCDHCFLFCFQSSLFFFPGCCSHPPSPSLPNSLSVQWQGTGSWHWLDFHTVPSTERRIMLIRVNNCGGALLSRAPIGLAWPGSGYADGLVISDLGAEGTDEGWRYIVAA